MREVVVVRASKEKIEELLETLEEVGTVLESRWVAEGMHQIFFHRRSNKSAVEIAVEIGVEVRNAWVG